MLARSKLNSIENKISEALINNEISHEDFMIEKGKKKTKKILMKLLSVMKLLISFK